MEFKIIYEGKIKSNAKADEKHKIRQEFHQQLKELWKYPPLIDAKDWINLSLTDDSSYSSVRKIGKYNYAALVTKDMNMYCELDFLILKPNMTAGAFGDLDNKLKTIFDALRCPNSIQEIPNSWKPNVDQEPLICLMDDDELITRINVNVDKLLRPSSKDEVIMIITVKVRGEVAKFSNLSIIV